MGSLGGHLQAAARNTAGPGVAERQQVKPTPRTRRLSSREEAR